MNHKSQKIITRFAPSPTGYLHIGSVRTALYAYLFAKKNNGEFILRIEDTDKAREVDGSIDHIIESMHWLGIDWDFGPDKPGNFDSCLQSERLDIYKEYAKKLIANGFAYPDPYSAEELAAFREEAQADNRQFLYRTHRPETFADWDGTKPLRFKTPEVKRYEWNDAVRGKLTAGEEMLDDIILIKADGYPTYNFAHIVDDIEMKVTHVMRGEEFISSTPKFLSIYDALGVPYPIFATLPPIMGPDGNKKLSKRDGAKDLLEYRSDGYLPEAMTNFLALIGWNPGGDDEIFNPEQLIELFTLEKIQKSGGAFNAEKLLWMNKEYLQMQSIEFLADYLDNALNSADSPEKDYDKNILQKLAPVIFERIHNKIEIRENFEAGEYSWAFTAPIYEAILLKWKKDDSIKDAEPRLQSVMKLLEEADFSTKETIKTAIWDYVEKVGRGDVLWPLRVALSGREKSPDPFTIAHTIGKEETISRIITACDKINK